MSRKRQIYNSPTPGEIPIIAMGIIPPYVAYFMNAEGSPERKQVRDIFTELKNSAKISW